MLPRIYFPKKTNIQSKKIGIRPSTGVIFSKYIEQIRYAARNRLYIELEYHGYRRLVEPYSLRQAQTEDQLLYVFELIKGNKKINRIKSYKILKYILMFRV